VGGSGASQFIVIAGPRSKWTPSNESLQPTGAQEHPGERAFTIATGRWFPHIGPNRPQLSLGVRLQQDVVSIPVLHYLSSPDLERNVLPPDPESCAVAINAEIGPREKGGADNFFFTVVTPDQILSGDGGARWGRGYLVVSRFSWEAVDRTLSKLLLHADRDTWEESARELTKELHWEFDNYTEASRR
jgi:hypothetical protein